MSAVEQFDYLVIGAGSAGCVLANRLSADSAHSVCLLEAGPSDRSPSVAARVRLPIGASGLLPNPRFNWQHSFADGERLMPVPRGKLFGGSSAINGMIYTRGQPQDFDGWAALGNPGWSYAEVLPVFRRHENRELGGNAFHGTGGELNVAPLRSFNPLSRAFLDAAHSLQIPLNTDFNGATQDGVGPFEVTQKNGERLSSARAFLHPALHRPNLSARADVLVRRILIEDGRAVGVELSAGGATREIRARAEVILCAGAVNTPQLLMLSGIGPADHLHAHGIAPLLDLPGVGANLQDHPTIGLWAAESARASYALTPRSIFGLGMSAIQYLLFRRGRLSSNIIEAGGFLRTRPELDRPDLQFHLVTALGDPKRSIPRQHGVRLLSTILRPDSRGRVTLRSADPQDKPVLQPNFLESEADMDCLLAGLRLSRRILAAPAFGRFGLRELNPGAEAVTEDALRSYISANLGTAFHPAGTAKMGPATDPLAVVDARLRLHGVAGLRVADASIMPTIVSGNTNAPTIMIGERCADFLTEAGQ